MPNEPRLEVYGNRSILVDKSGSKECFREGKQTRKATQRLSRIKKKLHEGFLQNIIDDVRKNIQGLEDIDEETEEDLKELVASVTSEVGRALVGLTILQLLVKAIVPKQSIRLHKASNAGGKFSWSEGIPMRSLDKEFITPVLRHNGLLKLNADGFMMTRSLAENYPYSKLYKAAIKGGRESWFNIVERVEWGKTNAKIALKHLIAHLINKSERFEKLAENTINACKEYLSANKNPDNIISLVQKYVDSTTYAARIFEIALYSFMLAVEAEGVLEGTLKPLSQMRSANKKHGNVGDIEIIKSDNSALVLEAWDAKYGKPYLRDELEELNDKLELHQETELAGFVVNATPNLKKEILTRLEELEESHDCKIVIQDYNSWIDYQISRYSLDRANILRSWLLLLAECLCQKKRDKAPIDEPCDEWVEDLNKLLRIKTK